MWVRMGEEVNRQWEVKATKGQFRSFDNELFELLSGVQPMGQ